MTYTHTDIVTAQLELDLAIDEGDDVRAAQRWLDHVTAEVAAADEAELARADRRAHDRLAAAAEAYIHDAAAF